MLLAALLAAGTVYSSSLRLNSRSKWRRALSRAASAMRDLCAVVVIAAVIVGAAAIVGQVFARGMAWVALCLFVVPLIIGLFIDVNSLSLHVRYRDALIRSFLGASNGRRQPDPLTNDDPRDDIPLCEIRQKPFPVICASRKLDHQRTFAFQRIAESFTLTPLHCGSETVGFRPAMQYAGGITLGCAAAISGAAIRASCDMEAPPPAPCAAADLE
jgi:hypothetical protein